MEAGNRSSQRGGSGDNLRRFTTETKASFQTSEFWLTIATIVGILIAALVTDGEEGFGANQAWLFVAIVVGAYSVGRGLAKSGAYEPYAVDRSGETRGNSG